MKSTNPFPRMHVSLYVADIAKTIPFYTAFFGQEPAKVKPGYAKWVLESPSLIISFVENPERVHSAFGHLGFQVERQEEVFARLEAARAAKLPVTEEMGTACCYALQDKFWVNDPDGHQWEVYYFHADAEFNDPRYGTGEANACCMPTTREQKQKVSLASRKPTATEACCVPGSGCC